MLALLCVGTCVAQENCRTDPAGPTTVESSLFNNFFCVNELLPPDFATTVYCGGQPQGAQAFEHLAKRGVKTIVSVDGSRPDLELARKYGLSYVHIPLRYDGISRKQALALVRVYLEDRDAVYVHCHHGQHRAPAAVAVGLLTAGLLPTESAQQILVRGGTAKQYVGLWKAIAAAKKIDRLEELPTLVEAAKVDELTTAMAALDREYARLSEKGHSKKSVSDDVAHAALMIAENLRELQRADSNVWQLQDPDFRKLLAAAHSSANRLSESLARLQQGETVSNDLGSLIGQLGNDCQKCHQEYRD